MNLSFHSRIFLVLIVLSGIILGVLWWFVRPAYETGVLEERHTLVQNIQNYAIEALDKQFTTWLNVTRGVTIQLLEAPKEGESFVRHTMILHPEILRIRIHSAEHQDELVSQNIHHRLPKHDFTTLPRIAMDDSTLCLGWSTIDTALITQSSFTLGGTRFFTTIWWDAYQLQMLLQRLPFGTEYVVVLFADTLQFFGNVPFSSVLASRSINPRVHRFQTFTLNGTQWYGVTTSLQSAPLELLVAVPESVVKEPVNELLLYSTSAVGILFVLLLILGWVLAYHITKPINRLIHDVEKLSTLDFSHPIRPIGMKDIRQMAETIEIMRQSLERYQRLNVERIIVEEWKNKLFMLHSDDLIGITDPDGVFIFKNTKFEEFCSILAPNGAICAKQQLLELPSLTILKQVEREEIAENVVVRSTQYELKVHLPQEEVQYFRVSDSTLLRGNASLGSLLILHDLTNDRLVDKMKSDMMNIVVHELRNPVGSIIGFAHLMVQQEDISNEEKREYLGYILESGNRLLNLINRFLDISRLESRRIEYPKVHTDVSTLVRRVVESQQPQLKAKNLRVDLEFDPPVQYATVAPELFQEAVLNLLSNAIKYGDPDRTITIVVRTENGSLSFSITDHGYGIPLEAQEKLFSKFYRVANPKTQREVGTGLGLAYVKEIVTYHNGTITLESTPEIGCRFTITIPLTMSHETS
ncbi:MAG: ATP-binding protein [Bacteroidetes bacterium]|nr:ATP-binding protein [Bacteroidota bacterium]